MTERNRDTPYWECEYFARAADRVFRNITTILRLAAIVALLPFLHLEPACAAEELSPAEAMLIARETGYKMKSAGFDRAEFLGFVTDFDQQRYTATKDKLTSSNRDPIIFDEKLRDRYLSISPVLRIATVAAHEHCHAYLHKHRNQLPPRVARASEACSVIPDSETGRMFDEIFCDMAAVNVIGTPARILFETLREDESGFTDTEGIKRYLSHSQRILELALASNPHHINNPVTRTAIAMETACRQPEVQEYAGTTEYWYGSWLTEQLAIAMGVATDDLPPIEFPKVTRQRKTSAKDNQPLRQKVDNLVVIAFTQANNACQQHLDQHPLQALPNVEPTMARCSLSRSEYNQSYCALASVYATGWVMRPRLHSVHDYRLIADHLFGSNSLASQIIQNEYDYNILNILPNDNESTKDFSLRAEFACGSVPEELREAKHRSHDN